MRPLKCFYVGFSLYSHTLSDKRLCVFYGPHVVHWGDRQEEVKSCSSQEDCLQERLRNYVEWIAKKPEFGKELPAEGRSKSTSNQQFYLKNPE